MKYTPQRIFVLLLLASSVSVFLWAANTEVDVIVRTVGQIIPAGKSQLVQHLEGGIVRRILVHEGETVAAGQPLMELSDVQSRSNLEQEKSALAALRGREARLIAEVDGTQKITFPKELDDPNVIRVETSAWQTRRDRLAEEVRVLRAQGEQKRNELAEIKSRQQNLVEELSLAKKKNQVIEKLRANNAASELEVIDSQMRIQRIKSDFAEVTNTIPRLQAALSESESREKEAAARFKAEASAALTQVREDLEKLSYGMDSSFDRLRRNIVRSPVAGLINQMNIATIGAVVRPSEVLLEITPSDQRIVVETRSNPNDRAHLRRGLPARVRVGAYDYSTYGTFRGRVTDVSADTLMDEHGIRYYRVNVEVDAASLNAMARQPGILMPGMGASVDISVGKRTILSYILSPMLEFRDGAFRAN